MVRKSLRLKNLESDRGSEWLESEEGRSLKGRSSRNKRGRSSGGSSHTANEIITSQDRNSAGQKNSGHNESCESEQALDISLNKEEKWRILLGDTRFKPMCFRVQNGLEEETKAMEKRGQIQ